MLIFLAPIFVLVLVVAAARWSVVVAQPDEWLLLMRDGQLAAGGIGVRAWRRPGDVVARFSSTIQRVAFEVEAQTREHLSVKLEGFALWSVGKRPEQALLAFSGLGLVNYERDPGAAATRHTLAKPQHRAFQAYFCAELQQLVSQLSLREALAIREQQASLVVSRISSFMASVGVELGQLEIISARPSDSQVSDSLAAPERELLKAQAQQAQVSAGESSRVAKMEFEARMALRTANDRIAAAEAQLKAEEAEAEVRRVKQLHDARIERDVGLTLREIDEGKSPELRELELTRLAIERAAEALKKLPITDAKWVSIGEGGPTGQMLALAELLKNAVPARGGQ